MQFSKVIAASFALLGAAVALPSPQAPSPNPKPAVTHALNEFKHAVTTFEKATSAASCDWITCLESLAASSAACAAALEELGLSMPFPMQRTITSPLTLPVLLLLPQPAPKAARDASKSALGPPGYLTQFPHRFVGHVNQSAW
ncbi:hypothetical protein PAAG_04659 [Paracoccidioides lutzii Pb01]|uniref:Fungal calcium binding protein domain-containing protein n=1 Tax=Paracoccidioides lutzii (strain ATCC MYA-826 / Pb01) TaxID=502779 RepID=C1H229_PARBA|nr:hypothetical protein PAAG_04659 [Paracoccidioides lutzii Pb01]EEH33609.2 hypothetical protein PAAG_04659 [Paracoccidioides lutzii Pb01]